MVSPDNIIETVEELKPTKKVSPETGPAVLTEFLEGEDNLIIVKVSDILKTTKRSEPFTCAISPSLFIGDFLKRIATEFDINLNEYGVTYQAWTKIYDLTRIPPDTLWSSIDVLPSKEKTYKFLIEKKIIRKTKNYIKKIETAIDVDAAGDKTDCTATVTERKMDNIAEHKMFAGIVNKQMTCYLNTLLQSYFFVPELRNEIYEFKSDEKNQCDVVHAMQRLFLRLQFMPTVTDTDELTRAFGWSEVEGWEQQDIEELFTVLNERISKELNSRNLKNFIPSLFEGLYEDYVQCLNCKYKSARNEKFYSLSLPIRSGIRQLEKPQLEEAIKNFVEPEVLDGNNQYLCQECGSLQDAHKGLQLKRLPYIVCILMKRFEFNFETNRRFKVHDEVNYQTVLNLNKFVNKDNDDVTSTCSTDFSGPSMSEKSREVHSRPFASLSELQTVKRCFAGVKLDEGGGDNAVFDEETEKKLITEALKDGPEVYILCTVMVHRGSLLGGHYYGFVRDFESDCWLRCDDANVRQVPVEEVLSHRGSSSIEDRDIGTAYFLMYRRYSEEKNKLPYLASELPEHLKDINEKLMEEERKMKEQDELERNSRIVTVHWRRPFLLETDHRDFRFYLKDKIINAALSTYSELFGKPDNTCYRFVLFDIETELMIASLDDNQTIEEIHKLEDFKGHLLLEIFKPNEVPHMRVYSKEDVILILAYVNTTRPQLGGISEIHFDIDATMEYFESVIKIKYDLGDSSKLSYCYLQGTRLLEITDDIKRLDQIITDEKVVKIFFTDASDMESKVVLKRYATFMNLSFEVTLSAPQISDEFLEKTKVDDNAYCFGFEVESMPLVNGVDTLKIPPNKETPVSDSSPSNANTVIDSTLELPEVEKESMKTPPKSQESCNEISSELNGTFHDFPTSMSSALVGEGLETSYVEMEKDPSRVNTLYLRVDGRTTCRTFSKILEKVIGIEEEQFAIFYCGNEQSFKEMTDMEKPLHQLRPIKLIVAKPGKRLHPGDRRISIFYFFLGQPPLALGDVVVNDSWKMKDVVRSIVEQLGSSYPELLDPNNKYHLRRKNVMNPGRIFEEEIIFENCRPYHNGVYIEPTVDYFYDGEKNKPHALFVRVWNSPKKTISQLIQVMLFLSYEDPMHVEVTRQLSKFFSIAEENVLIARPPRELYDYPWEVNPLACRGFEFTTVEEAANAKGLERFQLYGDDTFVVIRDKTWEIAELTSEEVDKYSKQLAALEQSNYASYDIPAPVRKETGIKIAGATM